MKRLLWIVVGLLAVLVLVPLIIGSFMPRDHVASLAIQFAAPPERVWAVVADFQKTVEWRKDITSVRMGPSTVAAVRFTESSSGGDVSFEVVSQDPPRRQVVRVVDDDQPFGGTWTWELEPAGTGTRLTVTEAGFVKNPMFRAVGAIFFSPTDTIRGYLRALAAHLGEQAEPKEIAAPAR